VTLLSIDWALRGGACALALLLAGAILRDFGRSTAARLGAAFAVGTAAYAMSSATGFHPSAWTFPIVALSAGNNVVFWLLASALFDDGFRPRWWHGALWLALIVAGTADCLLPGSRQAGPTGLLSLGLVLSSLGFAALAIGLTLSSWRSDLVEGRRRMRLFVVAASSAYIGLTALFQLLGTFRGNDAWGGIVGAAGLLAITGAVAWSVLRIGGGQSLFLVEAAPIASPVIESPLAAAEKSEAEAVDPMLVARLEQAMTVDRVARQDGLTIGGLAQRLGLPEYRLRRLINQALGYRNFNAFLNHYRIAEVKAALSDPAQAEVPVLTLALDSGFSSLGPFNRAFKAETGLTPSEFRRLALENAGVSGISRSISESASRPSNAARGNLPAH
jgi:AraC-like DNA-binding protein